MKKLNIKSKLLFLSIIPILFILMLSYIILSEMFNDKKNLEFTKHHILEASAISRVVHFMQIERALTVGLISSGNLDNKDNAIVLARNELDKSIDNAKDTINSHMHKNNSGVLKLLEEIKSNRQNIGLLNLPLLEAKNYYTSKIAILLNEIKTIPSMMEDKENRNFIQASSHLSSAKEALGQTRAILVEAFTSNQLLNYNFLSLITNLEAYNSNSANFKTIAPKDILDFYDNHFKGEALEETFKMIDMAIANKNSNDFDIEPSYWFKKSTESINLLKDTENELFNHVTRLINKKLDSIFYKISMLSSFLLFTIIALAILMTLIVRKILSSANTLEQKYSNSLSILEQYKSTVDRSFIVSKTDPRGVITYVNDEFCNISYYTKDELMGNPHNIIRHPDMPREAFSAMWHTIKDLKQPWFGEVKNRKKDGSFYWVKAFINPILDNNGNVMEYIGIRTDITQQKRLAEHFEKQLMISVKNFDCSMHLSKEYENAIDISTILSKTDKDGYITYANDKFLEICEYPMDELIGKKHSILRAKDTDDNLYKSLWETITKAQVWKGIIKNRSKSGKYFWTDITIVPIKDLNNEIVEYLAIRNDITEIIQQRKEFEQLAKTDSLTGYGNRFGLNSDIEKLQNLSIAIFNLDNFRQINDFYGHQFGDFIIISIANKIYNIISKDKNLKFYRLQGDEFVALAVDCNEELFIAKIKDILNAIKEKFTIQNEEILLSCSCGISFEESEQLLSTANMALNIAKKSNIGFLIYDESLSLNNEYKNNRDRSKFCVNRVK